jgi:hypothetical protein
MREIIPLMEFMKEATENGISINVRNMAIHCKIYEDNSFIIELAKVPNMRLCTKHLNIKYHHFHQHVQSGLLSSDIIEMEDHITDMSPKPLNETVFPCHRKQINGW